MFLFKRRIVETSKWALKSHLNKQDVKFRLRKIGIKIENWHRTIDESLNGNKSSKIRKLKFVR